MKGERRGDVRFCRQKQVGGRREKEMMARHGDGTWLYASGRRKRAVHGRGLW